MDSPAPSASDAPPLTPSLGDALSGMLTALATAQGMSVQEFVFGGIGLVLAPMEDRIVDKLFAKIQNTAQIGKPNDDLQADFDKIAPIAGTGGL